MPASGSAHQARPFETGLFQKVHAEASRATSRPLIRIDLLSRRTGFLTVFRVLVVATRVSLRAAIRVGLVAASLAAFIAALFTVALIPDRVGQQFDGLHRDRRVVAGDEQFAAAGALFGCLVADGEA